MKFRAAVVTALFVLVYSACLGVGSAVAAVQQESPQVVTAPTVFRIDGRLTGPGGEARAGSVVLVAGLYAEQDDETPLWVEEQLVTLDDTGRYTLLVGATTTGGVPREFFLSGVGRWLGIRAAGESEQPRVMLVTVPYALKALEAETLAGRAASEFVLAEGLKESVRSVFLVDPITAAGALPNAPTANALVKYTDGAGTTDASGVLEVSGNIGIGTGSPVYKLQVVGGIGATSVEATTVRANTSLLFSNGRTGFREITGNILTFDGGSAYPEGYRFPTLGVQLGAVAITNDGNVGIGTLSPASKLEVSGTVAASTVDATNVRANSTLLFSSGRFGFREITGSILTFDGGSAYPQGYRFPTLGAQTGAMAITNAGDVGIGTLSPSAKLHVTGNVVVDGNIGAKYQDVAEWVDAAEPIDAGTVVIVDPEAPNHVRPATRSYDTRVAGAVSAQPGLVLGVAGEGKALVAQSGRVRVKVDASYGAIAIGDLLVTSPTPGHAMRSQPVKVGGGAFHRPGTLLGKALEPLQSGKGEILVLLTLQ